MKKIITFVIYCSLLLSNSLADKNQTSQRKDTINNLIKALDDENFSKREAAAKELEKLGKAAIPALTKAIRRNSPESSIKALNIIITHYNSDDKKNKERAKKALKKIAELGNTYAKEATQALNPPKAIVKTKKNSSAKANIHIEGVAGKTNSISVIIQNGITTVNAKENGSHVIINKSPEGITIENTTENNGVKETQKFKAANAEGLKKNHPEAYKLLQKYTENIQTNNDDGGIRIKVESNSKNN